MKKKEQVCTMLTSIAAMAVILSLIIDKPWMWILAGVTAVPVVVYLILFLTSKKNKHE